MLDTIPLKRNKLQRSKPSSRQTHVEHTKLNQKKPLTQTQKILIGVGVVAAIAIAGIAILRFSRAATNTAVPPANLNDITSFVNQLAPTQTAVQNNFSGYGTFRYSPSTATAISTVAYYVDGVKIYSTDTSPYTFTFDSQVFSDGQHTITAVAFNNEGLPIAAVRRTITIANGNSLWQQGRNIITYPWNWLFDL